MIYIREYSKSRVATFCYLRSIAKSLEVPISPVCCKCMRVRARPGTRTRGYDPCPVIDIRPYHYPNGPGEQVVKVRACGQVRSEYSCRCYGKRVISAPSKPLKLKLAGPGQLGTFVILYCYINMVKLDCGPTDFVRRRFVLAIFAIRSEMAY